MSEGAAAAKIRAHHYLFGNTLLSQAVFRDSGFLFNVGRDERLLALWDHAVGQMSSTEIRQAMTASGRFDFAVLSPTGLQCTIEDLGSMRAAVVEMPPAERANEVIYAVAIGPTSKRGPLENRPEPARYFVLERSDVMGVPGTKTSELTPQGRRLLGAGPLRFGDIGPPDVLDLIQELKVKFAELDHSRPLDPLWLWLPSFLTVLNRDFNPIDVDKLKATSTRQRMVRSTFLQMVAALVSV